MEELTLHFVRHGETADNAVRRFQMPEAPLSDRGREQAAQAARALSASTRPELLLSSDYARTMETAQIIGGVLGLTVVPQPALRERNFGSARGRLYSEFGEEMLAAWRDPFVRVPDGESWADVHDRMGAFLDALRRDPPAPELILVTHGGAMSVALSLLEARAVADFTLTPLENCAIRTIRVARINPTIGAPAPVRQTPSS